MEMGFAHQARRRYRRQFGGQGLARRLASVMILARYGASLPQDHQPVAMRIVMRCAPGH